MTVVFVSGDIGSGKSSFCSELQSLGAAWISSDALVTEVYQNDPTVASELEAALGTTVTSSAGEIDRLKLADAVFGSAESRAAVERIVHPRVRELLQRRLSETTNSVIIYEITALKHDSDTSQADVLCEVVASPSVRIERLVQRAMERPEAERRVASQLADETRRHDVDVTVLNESDPGALRSLAASMYREWVAQND